MKTMKTTGWYVKLVMHDDTLISGFIQSGRATDEALTPEDAMKELQKRYTGSALVRSYAVIWHEDWNYVT